LPLKEFSIFVNAIIDKIFDDKNFPIYSMILCIEGIHHQIALHLILTSYSVMLTSTVDFYFTVLIILLAFETSSGSTKTDDHTIVLSV